MTINFSRKVNDLIGSGMTYKSLASKANCDPSTIYRLKSGEIEEPRYSVGRVIDELHAGLPVAANAKHPLQEA